jgi:hypothetical protein
MFLLGAGAGLSFPALMALSMSAATPSDSGLASGLVNTTLQVGGALGLAVLATLSAGRSSRLAADGQSAASALNSGYHLAVALGTGFVAVALVLAATVLRSSKAPVSEAVETGGFLVGRKVEIEVEASRWAEPRGVEGGSR